jgi:RimJ/RimL family protein N-acetyltransferase
MGEETGVATTFEQISWPVRTARLTIRPAVLADLPRLYEIRSQPVVTQWLTGRTTSYDDYVARYGAPDRMSRTLVAANDAGLVGDLMLQVESPWSQAEATAEAENTQGALGWCVDPAYSGRGYATEAAAELLRICFEELGLRRVVAGAFADNAASVRVMEKIGMRIESRTRRSALHRDLGWLDGVEAAILAEEWRAKPIDRP